MTGLDDFADISSYISVKQAAEILGISHKRLYKYIEDQRLPATKPGRDYLIPRQAVEQLKLKTAGRPREKTPPWNEYRGGSNLLATGIQVQIRPGQQEQLVKKLKAIRSGKRHTFTGSIARYVLRDRAVPETLSIWLVWKDTEIPGEEQRRRELVAFQDELADVVDWQTAQYSEKEGLIYT